MIDINPDTPTGPENPRYLGAMSTGSQFPDLR
jgi:hypothetical protein